LGKPKSTGTAFPDFKLLFRNSIIGAGKNFADSCASATQAMIIIDYKSHIAQRK
jgi:hypothetical protein